jgi:antirestriction protein ArdC
VLSACKIASKAYRGVNILALWAASDAAGYESGTWGTYRQWAEAGAQVKKGEKAAYVVFYKEIGVSADEQNENDNGARLFARATPVFAAEQVDGLPSPALPKPPASPVEPIERAEPFSPQPARTSSTAAAAPATCPAPTTSTCPRLTLSSAPQPARPPKHIISEPFGH